VFKVQCDLLERQQQDDRLLEQELPRPAQRLLVQGLQFDVLSLVGFVDVFATGDLGQERCSTSQQDDRVGLGEEQGADDGEQTGEQSDQGCDPSPAASFTEESTQMGPTAGPRKGAAAKIAIPKPRCLAEKRSATVPLTDQTMLVSETLW
jgi:hypothetical protein